MAVGPSHVLETVNTEATVYSKTGTALTVFDFSNFWVAGSTSETCVDPRALYIPSADRYAFSCTDNTSGGKGQVRFAISQTSDPTKGWFKYAAAANLFLDQDKIEATADKFVIAGNSSTAEEIYVYNLSDVIAGVPHPAVVHRRAVKSNLYQAAVQQTQTSNAYFVSSYPGNKLYLATITGTPAASNVALSERMVSSADFPAPVEPSVPGGNIGGGDLDGRIYTAVYERETSDGKPVIEYSSARGCGTRDCVTNARVDLSGSTPVLTSDILVGEPGFDYTYGGVGLDGAGNVFEVYTRTSPTEAPGLHLVGPGFDVSIRSATPGSTACTSPQTSGCDERWGDYQGMTIDPSNPSSVWLGGLYQAASGGFNWGTEVASVTAASFALPAVTTGAATVITPTGASIAGTVNPKGVATTYHFDYGLTTGYDAATSETSAGSGTTATTVSTTLTGLQPNTLYHYRVVATTSTGSATSPDHTFKTKAPAIKTVTFTGSTSNPTVTITGMNFGPLPAIDNNMPCGTTGADYGPSGLWFNDGTQGWTAGQGPGDCIGLVVSTYTNTKIVFQFGSEYANFPPMINGDAYKLTIWGKQTAGTVSYS